MKHGLSIGGMLVQLLPESPSGTIWLITMLVIVGAVRGEERCLGYTSSPAPTPANGGYRGWGPLQSSIIYPFIIKRSQHSTLKGSNILD